MQLLYPVLPSFVTQNFGNKSPAYRDYHHGIDFRTRNTDRKIRAVRAGKVIIARTDGRNWFQLINNRWHATINYRKGSEYGNYIIIDHGGYFTLYGHLSLVYVKSGEQVRAGQDIGKAGSTGKSKGEHLHFELRIGRNDSEKAISAYPYFVYELEDVEDVPSEWAKRAQKFVRDTEISNGKNPHEALTREEVWVMQQRFYEKLVLPLFNKMSK